ncbi:hypothetical protein CONPUDRAFT_162771 [Coniophora puteana RWD-64-598 SS2]|uniref:DUF6534 domain-containing protein n=1 Tax=Coniophora puteana (strain RWD-64-598) TaxID=741705 RepID=A0A5M3N3L3_CONPW|nr:uncharacterized protein CONPUDRAFT_162771 [Coniophora puteana RWD-64-598 SS2]EIW85604.1 hypothetical protein CONPUDRAFT_162771 [Coniophora puteana RWD-64-598 SS2]
MRTPRIAASCATKSLSAGCGSWMRCTSHLSSILYTSISLKTSDATILDQIVWSFKLQIVVDVLVVYSVHCLYAYRLYLLSRGRRIYEKFVYLACFIVLLGAGVAISLCWAVYRANVYPTLVTQTRWATYMALGSMVVIDFMLASSMCYLFQVSRTGLRSTDSILKKLMRYVIQTGVLTSLCSLSAVICLAAMPGNFVFLGIEFFITKLYVNSLLALLNACYYDRKPLHGTSSAQRSNPSQTGGQNIVDQGEAKQSNVIVISQSSTTETSDDAYPPKPRSLDV